MDNEIEFRQNIAIPLLGMPDLKPKELQALSQREKPEGMHHMVYFPEDLKNVRYAYYKKYPDRLKGIPNDQREIPPVMVFRMTKGGVGKTSISTNVATCLAMMGYRVLFIDADAQATATNIFGIDSNSMNSEDVFHVGNFLLRNTESPDPDIQKAITRVYGNAHLDLIPADLNLTHTEGALTVAMGNVLRVDSFLTRNASYLRENYDAIIFDTAPGTTPVSMAVTYASRHSGKLLAVIEPDGGCFKALHTLNQNLMEIGTHTKVHLGLKIILNNFTMGHRHAQDKYMQLVQQYPTLMNLPAIPSFVGFSRQLDDKPQPLILKEPKSAGGLALISLTQSLINEFGIRDPNLPVFYFEKD